MTFIKLTRHVKELRARDPALYVSTTVRGIELTRESLQSEEALTLYSNIVDDYLVALSAHIEALEVRAPPASARRS